jgi:nucleotide-binding universal stress UspA family protein
MGPARYPSEVIMFHRIVVPTDLTSNSKHALDMALALASPHDAHVTLLHVIERIPNLEDRELRTFYDRLERDARRGLRDLVAHAHIPGQVEIVQELVFGRRADEIVEMAKKQNADLIVLQHSQDDHPLLGSISYKVSVLAPCTTLLLK